MYSMPTRKGMTEIWDEVEDMARKIDVQLRYEEWMAVLKAHKMVQGSPAKTRSRKWSNK